MGYVGVYTVSKKEGKINERGFRVNVTPEEGSRGASKSQLFYPPPDVSDLDISVQLSVEELRTVVNIAGDDTDAAHPYLVALWKKPEPETQIHDNTR